MDFCETLSWFARIRANTMCQILCHKSGPRRFLATRGRQSRIHFRRQVLSAFCRANHFLVWRICRVAQESPRQNLAWGFCVADLVWCRLACRLMLYMSGEFHKRQQTVIKAAVVSSISLRRIRLEYSFLRHFLDLKPHQHRTVDLKCPNSHCQFIFMGSLRPGYYLRNHLHHLVHNDNYSCSLLDQFRLPHAWTPAQQPSHWIWSKRRHQSLDFLLSLYFHT